MSSCRTNGIVSEGLNQYRYLSPEEFRKTINQIYGFGITTKKKKSCSDKKEYNAMYLSENQIFD